MTQEGPSPFAVMEFGTSDGGYQPIPWFGSDGSIWLIASPGLCCPLLPVGGLLAERGHLVSSNAVPVSEPR